MADEKLNTGPAENIFTEAAEPIATPEQAAASEPQQEQTEPAIPEPGDMVVSFDKINELMAEKRQNARAEVEKAETPETPKAAAPGETPQPANTEEPKKPRRGRPPKAEKAATENQKAEKSAGARKGRPPKADKAAPDKPKPSKRDKVSRSDGKAPDAKEPIKPAQDTAPKETATAEQTAPEPTTPPRPVEEGKPCPYSPASGKRCVYRGRYRAEIQLRSAPSGLATGTGLCFLVGPWLQRGRNPARYDHQLHSHLYPLYDKGAPHGGAGPLLWHERTFPQCHHG